MQENTVGTTKSAILGPAGTRERARVALSPRLDLVTLKLFVAIVEERCFARAARRECIAPSAASKRISDLEHALGLDLLIRSRGGAEPTEAGRALLHHARTVLSDLGQLETELDEFSRGTSGVVRIAANDSSIFSFLPGELHAFLAEHPRVRIEVQADISPRIVQAVADGLADIGLFSGDIPTADLTVFPYHDDALLVAVPTEHPLAGRGSVRFSDLLDYELIFPEARSSIDRLLFRAAAELGRALKARIRVGGFETVFRMVEMGIGIGIVPEPFARCVPPSMRVRTLPLDEEWAIRTHRLCVRALEGLPAAARLLVERFMTRQSAPAG